MIFKKNSENIYADVKICPESDFEKRGGYDYLNPFATAGRKTRSVFGRKYIENRKAV